MSVEFDKAKHEALDALRTTARENLQQLQNNAVQGEASFRDYWGWCKAEWVLNKKPNILERVMGSSMEKRTWVEWTYIDGVITGKLIQDQSFRQLYGEIPKVIQETEECNVDDIPFDKFGEDDLYNAARSIESLIPKSTIQIAS